MPCSSPHISGNTNVFYNGRCVSIESMHGGIEPSIITANLANPGISGRAAELRKEYHGRFVFLGIDKVLFDKCCCCCVWCYVVVCGVIGVVFLVRVLVLVLVLVLFFVALFLAVLAVVIGCVVGSD